MSTPHASHARRHSALDRCTRASAFNIAFNVAAALCTTACSKREPSMSSPDQAVAGTSGTSSDSAGMTSAAVSGSGAGATAPSAGTASMPSAGTGTAGSMPSAGSPAAGRAGAGAMSGAGGGPAAGSGRMPAAGAGGAAAAGACTRELLKTTIESYFAALAAHDPKPLPLADTLKFTENGKALKIGEGLWATAGMVKFKESLLDTQKCGTVTQAVVPDGTRDLPFALRLKLEAQKITEIQTIAVREGDYSVASNTRNMIALTPWGEIVPEDQRQTREQLEMWIDKYFRLFPMGVCNVSNDCKRMENGFTLQCSAGASCSSQEPSGAGVMKAQIILSDVEAGLAAGFTMFSGTYTDVHMVKYSGGQVYGVHTVLGEADSSGWD